MRNIDSSASSDLQPGRLVELFGKQVMLKNYICSLDGIHYRPKPENIRLQLSILLTRYCNAHCPFCIAAPTVDRTVLDLKKLREILVKLRDEECVRGISITGGEPFTDLERLDRTISMIFEIFGTGIEVTLNTNGFRIAELTEIHDLRYVDAVHISRHHWDDRKNEEVFGCSMPSAEDLKAAVDAVTFRNIFVINCMLLRGYVETTEDVHRFLDFSIGLGVPKVSFITAAPVNEFSRQKRIRFDDVLRDDDPSLLFTGGYSDYSYCRCRDGVYVSPQGRLIEFYGRQTETDGCPYCRGFVCTPEGKLTAGYGGMVLFESEQV